MATEIETAALGAVKAFQDAFRAQDYAALAAALNYPHIRLAKSRFEIYATPEEFIAYQLDRKGTLKAENWHTTVTRSLNIVHAGEDKVHIAITNDRCHADGTAYNRFETLWIATRQAGHWGIQFRSSFLLS